MESMEEIRFHGRGGQGAVTATTLLAIAGFRDGKYTQAFPKFGVERRGAPVQAYARIADKFVRRKCAIYSPDTLLVLDSTLFEVVDVTKGLKDGGQVIINSENKPEDFEIENAEVFTVDVTSMAMDILGRNIVNTGILGAFSAFTEEVQKDSIAEAIKEHFSGAIAKKNVQLVEKTYKHCKK